MAEGKILLILVIALLVLGPERLPKLAADVGRWVGRARGMARQLQAQLDQEVHVQNVLREQLNAATTMTPGKPATPAAEPPPSAPTTAATEPAPSAVEATTVQATAPLADPTYSHAHGPGDSHPDYAAPIQAAAAPPVTTDTPPAGEGNARSHA